MTPHSSSIRIAMAALAGSTTRLRRDRPSSGWLARQQILPKAKNVCRGIAACAQTVRVALTGASRKSTKAGRVLKFNPNGPDQALCRPFELRSLIRNSSILRPDFIAATSQSGSLPRPDQVSEVWGLRYFGSTLGYLRGAFLFWSDREAPD